MPESQGKSRQESQPVFFRRSYLVYAGEPFEFSDGITDLRYDQLNQVFPEIEVAAGQRM